MKQFFEKLENLPKWYAFAIIVAYSLLVAEFFRTLNNLSGIDSSMGAGITDIINTIMKISFVITIFAGVVTWIVMSLLFHLTALLLDGYAVFKRFLLTSAYFYIVPILCIAASIMMLDGVMVPEVPNAAELLAEDPTFKTSMYMVSYSYVPYYALCAMLIHNQYGLKYWKAVVAIIAPIVAVWGISQLLGLM